MEAHMNAWYMHANHYHHGIIDSADKKLEPEPRTAAQNLKKYLVHCTLPTQ